MNSNSVLERHADLYFADGDVVLAVTQTPKSDQEPPKYTLFRVHKFLLKHHSATFANFFADANAAPAEVYDGVPLAEMHGDKAEDFALLLRYLYNPSSLVFKRHDPNTPLTVTGVVRLADKYLIEPLHRCLVQQVCEDWPATLNDYDIKQGEMDTLLQVAISNIPFQYTPDGDGGRMADVIPEPASAIQFAQEFGCPQILPAAFYRLSLIPAALFLSKRCADAWEFDDSDDSDDGETSCYQFVARLFEVVFKEGPSATHGDPLRSLARCSGHWKMPELSKERCPSRLCAECQEALGIELIAERKRIWAELPQYFKLG